MSGKILSIIKRVGIRVSQKGCKWCGQDKCLRLKWERGNEITKISFLMGQYVSRLCCVNLVNI